MTLGLTALARYEREAGVCAWRIWRRETLKPPPPEQETIKVITDRMERDFEEIFRKWEH